MSLKNPKSFEWKALYGVAIALDILEPLAEMLFTEFFAAPEVIEEVLDPIIGICFGIYFQLRGVSMIQKPGRLVAMIVGDLAEQLSINTFPAWIGDVWYIHATVKQEWAIEQSARAQLAEAMEDAPVNRKINGSMMRLPPRQQHLNQNNKRLPTKTGTGEGKSLGSHVTLNGPTTPRVIIGNNGTKTGTNSVRTTKPYEADEPSVYSQRQQ